jgi:hypothetical protein
MKIVAEVEVLGDYSDVLQLLDKYPVDVVSAGDLLLHRRVNAPITIYVRDHVLQEAAMHTLESGGSWFGLEVLSVKYKRDVPTTSVGNHTHIVANNPLNI